MLTKLACCTVMSDTVSNTVGPGTSLKIPGLILTTLLMFLSATSAAATDDISLQARPQLCVVPPGEHLCSMQLQLSWTAQRDRNVCISLSHLPEPLQCWQTAQQGDHSVEFTHDANITVRLQDAQTGQVLAELDIPVLKRDLRDTRRRRRHAWSIF